MYIGLLPVYFCTETAIKFIDIVRYSLLTVNYLSKNRCMYLKLSNALINYPIIVVTCNALVPYFLGWGCFTLLTQVLSVTRFQSDKCECLLLQDPRDWQFV